MHHSIRRRAGKRVTLPMGFEPAYIRLYKSGELHKRVSTAQECMRRCNLCAQYCQADRTRSSEGAVCRTGTLARVHPDPDLKIKEAPLGSANHAGIIQFSGCNLRCDYCTDWRVSQTGEGTTVTADELAGLMLDIQARKHSHLHLISPSHVVAQILQALEIACAKGLSLPLVYHSGGYDSLEALQLLDGVVDIYAPDIKYGDNECARIYSHVHNYVEYSHIALREMYRQVGDLIIDEDGLARRGILVRHLVLPENQSSTRKVLAYISADISPNTYVNLMDSYQPDYQAACHEKLNRALDEAEIKRALRAGERCGLHRIELQMSRPWTNL